MNAIRLGCIADDYTGATDLSSMLVRAGLRVVQCFGIPTEDQRSGLDDADAIVVSLKSRSIAPESAVERSLDALRFLQSQNIDRFFFKYCSTFDSTDQGNIGPVAEALAKELDVKHGLFFCPGFPENGRTVHCGHLFVHGVLLHESGMRNHPLNPMTDSNLVRVLQAQSMSEVGWINPGETASSTTASSFIVDAVGDVDLEKTALIAKDHQLLTGGSAIAYHWADAAKIRKSGDWDDSQASLDQQQRCVILAGSCSDATRQQIAEFESTRPVLHLRIEAEANVDSIASDALQWCQQNWDKGDDAVLISSSADPAVVEAARQQFGEAKAAELTESVFAAIAKQLQAHGIRRIIVAGGETSGAVINALGIKAIRIGHEIAAGVPWVTSFDESKTSLALKSGNFGGPRFFHDALETS